MTLRYLSGYNGYLPTETGLVIGFVRKPEEFALNKYVQYIEAEKEYGAYAQLAYDDSVRLVDDRMNAWEDGDPAPLGEANKHRFQFLPFKTRRRAYPWTVGYLAMKQATWRPKQVYMDDAISICMTARTNRIVSVLENATNWGANTAPANTLNKGAGNWSGASDDPASPQYNAIYKTLLAGARAIHLFTNGKVRPRDLRLVIGPDLAIAMAESPEMTNYVRESPVALQVEKDGLGDDEKLWTLPDRYKGFKIVVEDAPIVTEAPQTSGTEATVNRTYIKPGATAYLLSRPGGLDGEYGTRSFSTIQLYHYDGLLKVAAFDEPKHERVDGRVQENIIEILAAAPAGYLITGCI